MPHIDEDKLIQYRFDLLEPAEQAAVTAHLESCDACRGRLDELARTFASLDLLNDEIEPSEELIRKAAALKKPTQRIWFKNVSYYFSAAAILIAGSLLYMVVQVDKKISPELLDRPVARRSVEPPQESFQLDAATEPAALRPSSAKIFSADTPADAIVAAAEAEAVPATQAVASIVAAEEIPDKPPFAPASAIELVVLPRPESTQLTIYNSADLTLVRDTRRITLKAGWNWLQFMWAGTLIDPTSLSIRPLEHGDRVEIEQLVYPARLKDIGRWLIRSEVEGSVEFEITYFASGLNWRATYQGTMKETEDRMDLAGFVRVDNRSGQDYANARTRLLLGQVRLLDRIADLARRQRPYGPDVPIEENEGIKLDYDMPVITNYYFGDFDGRGMMGGMAGGAVFYDLEQKEIAKEGLSEYTLYTIEGTETILDQWGKRLPSLDVEDIPVKSLYKYDEDRYGTDTVRFVSFANDEEHELGTTPLPEGGIQIYRRLNDRRNLAYVGRSEFKYIPVNEDVELNLGASRLVKIEPTLMDMRTANYTFDAKGNIDGWDEVQTWRVKLTNARDLPVETEITRRFATDTWDLKLNDLTGAVDYSKHDAARARFTATVPPQNEQVFEYTITQYFGQSAEIHALPEPVFSPVSNLDVRSVDLSAAGAEAAEPVTAADIETTVKMKEVKDWPRLPGQRNIKDTLALIAEAFTPSLPMIVLWGDLDENAFLHPEDQVEISETDTIGVCAEELLRTTFRKSEPISAIDFKVIEGVVLIATHDSLNHISQHQPNISKVLGLSGDNSIESRLQTPVLLPLFHEALSFRAALERLSAATEPPLPFIVMWNDLNENAFIQPDSPIKISDRHLAQTPSAGQSLRNRLDLLIHSMNGVGISEICYFITEGVIVITSRDEPAETFFTVRDDAAVPTSSISPQVRDRLNQQVNITDWSETSSFQEAATILESRMDSSLKLVVQWEDLREHAMIEPSSPLSFSGRLAPPVSLEFALKLLLYSMNSTGVDFVNFACGDDAILISTQHTIEQLIESEN